MDRLTPAGKLAVQRFEDMLEVANVGEALAATGRSYDAFRKILLRSDRVDLVSKLTEWKRADNMLLHQALGLRWQG